MNKEDVDISTDIGGVKCSGPLAVSSHDPDKPWFPATPLDRWVNLFIRYTKAGAGHLIMPSIVPLSDETEPPEFYKHKGRRHYIGRWIPYVYKDWFEQKEMKVGYFWVGTTSVWIKTRDGEKLLRAICDHPEYDPEKVPMMGNVLCDNPDPKIWAEHAKWLEELGCQMLEINFGCPCGAFEMPGVPKDETRYGAMLGTLPPAIEAITKEVVKNVKVPCLVKLTPEAGYPGLLLCAEAGKRGGAKGVVTTHMAIAMPPPDIHGDPPGKTPWPFTKSYPVATIAGPAERFFMYKGVAMVHSTFPDLEIEAGAGIVHPEHTVEAIFLGAKSVQTLSGVVWNGLNFITRTNDYLRSYMAQHNFKTIEDFRGFTIKNYFKPLVNDDFIDAHAEVDVGKCRNCGICEDNWCPAITRGDYYAVYNKEECSGCGMCVMICPHDAVTLKAR
ncbi:MAG: tRNA-dihydrouridine synthase [Candidatus Bathyarchaeia archaeon]